MAGDHQNQLEQERERINNRLDDPARRRLQRYDTWLTQQKDLQPSVHRDYIGRTRRVVEAYGPEQGILDIHLGGDDPDDEDLTDVFARMGQPYGGYAHGTIRKMTQAVVYYLDYHDVNHGLEIPAVNQTTKVDENEVLDYEDEVQAMIDVAQKPRDKAIVATYWESANRDTALRRLKVKHYTKHGDKYGVIKIPHIPGVKGAEGNKKPLVMARAYLDNWIADHPCADDPDAALFCRMDQPRYYGKHMSAEAVRKILKRLAKRADIDPDRVSAHKFRHARVTYLKKHDDYSDSDVEANLDWTDGSQQHKRYSHIDQSDQIDSLLRASDVDVEHDVEHPRDTRECPRCNSSAPAGASYCPTCAMQLSDRAPLWLRLFSELHPEHTVAESYDPITAPRDVSELPPDTFDIVYELLFNDLADIAQGMGASGDVDADLTAQEAEEAYKQVFGTELFGEDGGIHDEHTEAEKRHARNYKAEHNLRNAGYSDLADADDE